MILIEGDMVGGSEKFLTECCFNGAREEIQAAGSEISRLHGEREDRAAHDLNGASSGRLAV